ncbi:hypothetical protein BMG05_19885 [Mycobacterium malmoense]|nr:hypothetical protein BMG05_19885 [Mycobacterium malmoense]
MSVDIFGGQRPDGTVKLRWVTASPPECPDENIDFDAAAARQYAYTLRNIAEIESITDPEEAAEGFALAETFEAAADEIDFWAAFDGSAG